jgi:drug/metabolite transporter (DMT)-like permease
MNNNKRGVIYSLLCAFLYGLNAPAAKIMLNTFNSTLLVALTYIGSGIGLLILFLLTKKRIMIPSLNKNDISSMIGIIFCDLSASLLMIKALSLLYAGVVSLLSVSEIAFTAIIAIFIFKKNISSNTTIGIVFVILSSIILVFNSTGNISFSLISLLVIIACALYGLENNLTERVSSKNPIEPVMLKCLSVGFITLLIFLISNTKIPPLSSSWFVPIIGFITCGVSMIFYVLSTKFIGATRTTTIFSFSPIWSSILSIILFKEKITIIFVISFILMIIGIVFASREKQEFTELNKDLYK